ncbi:hypothetical protein [Streptomyces sp. NPDC093094]|uniref:hypothetical protein n=1 Tax=Streptomyces sp. NPDC093094 TaxID=3366026 RepID=UPI003808FFF7
MTYLAYVYNAGLGASFPTANVTFPGYASSPVSGYPGWYVVGVGENQNFYATAPGFHPGPVTNSDQVDPNTYYFIFALLPIGTAQAAPPNELLERAAKHHADPSGELPS